jgi:ABC-type nitrate/sulfonate/bicarbonate transport system permease component
MAATGNLIGARTARLPLFSPVMWLRIGIIAAVVVIWETATYASQLVATVNPSLGYIMAKVTPSLLVIGETLIELLGEREFYGHLGVTIVEVASGMAIGGAAGLVIGLVLGANPFISRAFERFLYYLGPTPKIIFFPVMIMWFGVGPGSKVAMGTISAFFPVVLSVAAGMRQIESVLIRVGRSFRCNTWQMVTKIYLPAMRQPIVNGARLGFGVALIGTLLAETKLSNQGIGFLIIDAYNTFDMPRMYALLIVLFVIAIGVNALVDRASREQGRAGQGR